MFRRAEFRLASLLLIAGALVASPVLAGERAVRLATEGKVVAVDGTVIDAPADAHYADIRMALERAGTPIGSNDLLIAAHARARGLTLVTHNLREFARVPGLNAVDWLAA